MNTTENTAITKHTPTPWNCIGGSGYSIQDETGWEVAMVRNGTDDMIPNPAGENARHIVHCVNLHDELTDLLEEAVLRVQIANDEGDLILSAWMTEARAVLAKAKGGAL